MLPRAAWLIVFCAVGCSAAQPPPLGSAAPAPIETAAEPGDAGGFSDGGGATGSNLASSETADGATNESLDLEVTDEAPYPPGSRRRPPHPAPRVKVDIVKVQGKIEEANVLRTARAKGYWPFRLCYEDGLRRAPKLHGTVRFRVTLGPNGSSRGVRKVSAEVDDPLVVSCVLKAARNLTLTAPERRTPDVTLDVSFWPGDSPVGSPAAAARPTTTLENAEALVESLRARWPEVRACYAAGLRRKPGLWGRLAMKLRVTTTGQIVEASEVESRFPDGDVTECTLRAYERAGLSAANEERVIVYALHLGRPPE